jgi:DNA-binding winged helix-turn-helix (wHTH) protein/TolB-like protein
MNETAQDLTPTHSIDLAREADFDLGGLRVRPAKCEVEREGVTQTLQRRVMQVLVALAQSHETVVSQDELIARCWRGLSVTDDAIFRCISKLRKLAANYADEPYAIETVPGVGYRLSSPAYSPGEGPRAKRSERFSKLALGSAAALIVLVLLAAAFMFVRQHPQTQGHPLRVEVQPFEALSSSSDARALAQRVPNEIVDALGDSQIEAVLGGGGASPAGHSTPGIVVTGIVRNDGQNTTANVRIEDGTTRAALWSNEFRRDSHTAADLPLEVAARVADVVSMINYARSANPPLSDNSALTAVLQANDLIRDSGPDDWAQLLNRAQAIVARNPNFAFGHSLLAVAYAEAAENAGNPDRAKAMSDAASREANLTLKLDPQDAGAYAVLSGLSGLTVAERQAIVLRGIKVAKHPKQPVAALYSTEAKLLINVGRMNEALPFQLNAYAIDEWGAPKTAQLARTYANLGNMTVARSLLQKGLRLWPKHSGIRRTERYIVGFYGDAADATSMLGGPGSHESEDQADAVWRTFIEARLAHSPERMTAAARSVREAIDQNVISPDYGVMMLAALGKPGEAIGVGYSVPDQLRLESWVLFAPITRNVREDPGFVALASRLGLIQYWRETGQRPDFCTDPKRRDECSPQVLAALTSN